MPCRFVDISPLNLHLDTVIKPRVPVFLSLLPHHTLEQVDAEPDDAAKGFGRSASLDAAAAEGAGLRVGKEEGVACPPQWLPVLLASLGSPPRPSPPPPSPLPKAPAVCGSYNQTDCEATKMPGLKVVSELYAVRLQRIHPAARLRAC